MSADSTWKPAYDVSLSVGGTAIQCQDCSVKESDEEFETSNTEGNGFYEFGVGLQTFEISGTAVIDSGDVRMPTRRDLVAISWNDGINTMTGKGRITSRERKGGAKGAFTVPFSGKFTGTVVIS